MIDATTITKIAQLTQEAMEPQFAGQPGEIPTVLFPNHREIKSLEGYLKQPVRRRARLTMVEAAAFITYLNRYKQTQSLIVATADEKGGRFTAIVDYHEMEVGAVGETGSAETPKAQWGEHRVTFDLKTTPEWNRWMALSGRELTQVEFAEFLEDNAQDIIVPEENTKAPNSAQMLDVALTLQAKKDVSFASTIRLSSGQTQLSYQEKIDATVCDGKMMVPEVFYLTLPPFVGTPRYRLGGGKVVFRYEIERPHKIVEAAFKDVRAVIEKETALKVLLGTLESMGI